MNQDWDGLWRFVQEERHGAIHVDDGAAFGISRKALRGHAASESWPKPYPTVWLAPAVAADRFLTRVSAALLWVGAPAWIAGEAAARLHGLVERDPKTLELFVPTGRSARRRDGVAVVRTSTVQPHHVTLVRGLATTGVVRTILDCAARFDERRLRALMIDARMRYGTHPGAILQLAEELRKAPNRALVIELAEGLLGERVDSIKEHDLRAGMRRNGIEVYPQPFPYRCSDGWLIEWDLAVPWAWVAVEVDSLTYHGSRRAFYADRRKWAAGRRDGWDVRPFSTGQIRDDLAGVVAEVAAAVAAADPTRSPPAPGRPVPDGPGLVPPCQFL